MVAINSARGGARGRREREREENLSSLPHRSVTGTQDSIILAGIWASFGHQNPQKFQLAFLGTQFPNPG